MTPVEVESADAVTSTTIDVAMGTTMTPVEVESADAVTSTTIDVALGRRQKLFATGAAFLAYVALGLLIASLGASFLQLQRQTGGSPEELTFVFTLRSLGYLVGSAAGGVLLDKFHTMGTSTIAVSLFATAISTSLVPSANTVAVLCLLFCTQGVAMGALDTIANVIVIYLWESEAGPWMQGLHAAFAVGAVISPLVIRLSQGLSESGNSIHAAFYSFAIVTALCGLYFCFVPTPKPRQPSPSLNNDGGALTDTSKSISHADPTVSTGSGAGASKVRSGSRWCSYHFKIIFTTGALLGIYVGAETGFGGFVILFGCNHYGLSEADGQYINALFFGCLTLGRLVGIPLSRCISVTKQLSIDLALAAIGCIILLVGVDFKERSITTANATLDGAHDEREASSIFLWIGAAVFGSGLGTIFPCAVLQAEAFTDLSGRAASVLMVGAAIGEMLVPLAIGVWTAAWAPGFVVGIAITTGTFIMLSGALVFQGSKSELDNPDVT